jgi:hypothetical protein
MRPLAALGQIENPGIRQIVMSITTGRRWTGD